MKSSTITMLHPDNTALTALKPATFHTLIFRWFAKCGRKHLPWQQNKTPYRVWISEIMLQQTQVATVIPYFERFMQAFPTVAALASAKEDEVLHLWAGLGYYSRARNLHRAAKMIMETWNGELPDRRDDLITLPGIGLSTAGAILSIAFHQPTAILDGNVKRVLTRFHAICDPIDDKKTENQLWQLAEYYMPTIQTADYTQAMMDLGATLCTRSKPQCTSCPLMRHCAGYEQQIAASLPRKKTAKVLPVRSALFLVLKKASNILLIKRPALGIWGGLWSLPELASETTPSKITAYCRQQFRLEVEKPIKLPAFRHTFSHYHLDIQPVLLAVKKAGTKMMEDDEQIWYNPKKPAAVGLPKPVQSILLEML